MIMNGDNVKTSCGGGGSRRVEVLSRYPAGGTEVNVVNLSQDSWKAG
jgi:hypothetical protein